MPSVMKEKDEKAMATNAVSGGANERREDKPASAGGGSFFTIYKKGQGYWTRMGTAAGAALIGALTAYFIYDHTAALFPSARVAKVVAVGVFALFALFAFWLINKPSNADFLIATDSEMKKVNWTSRKELIGSTKVVILFMFAIATFLFVSDLIFGYLFYLFTVLKNPPF